MKLTYQKVKDINDLIKGWQDEYWLLRDKYGKDYPLDDKLDLLLLQNIIYELKQVSSMSTNLVDLYDLQSDIRFIEIYYEIKRFSSVNVWLSNVKSTLRETFSTYMNNLKKENHTGVNYEQ
jgi:hypothetical protein